MRGYETMFVVDPELGTEETESVVEKFKGIVTSKKGHILKLDKWGVTKLAYRIGKHTKGYYVLMEFTCDPSLITELERNLKIDDRILRYVTVKISDKFEMSFPPEEEAA